MNSARKLYPYVLEYRKVIIGIAIFLSLLAVGININQDGVQWFWIELPLTGILLILLCIILILVLIESERYRSISAINILEQFESKLHQLSRRQKEVFELITIGKSNKEICDILIIEQSTLKTHINQIYKIINVSNRKEAIKLGHLFQEESNRNYLQPEE